MKRLLLLLACALPLFGQATLPPTVATDFVWSFSGVTASDCIRRNADNTAWINVASASCGGGGGGSLTADSVGTSELDDDANTPTAGDIVAVETGAASFKYLTPNAGTDITADLEEETHASEHASGGGDPVTVGVSQIDDGAAAATFALFSGAGSDPSFRAIADADVPNDITIDLATQATTALAGDSATAFFSAGTIEAGRLPEAAAAAAGIVSIGVQDIPGAKTFKALATFELGAEFGTSGTGVLTMLEGVAAGAGSSAGEHNVYFDSADGLLKSHENGGSVVTYVNLDGTQTLTNKTLTTPTIGSFTNATHDHEDAAGGGTLGDAAVADTITASNYLPLAGGTMTGQIVADNLGIEFEDSDTNPTCAAGNYSIYADLSDTNLKKCVNGTVSDLDTTAGGGGSINVEEGNVEVISSANLTGIDFLGADFDVTDDANEADVAIAAAITRDAEWDTAAEINAATTDDDFVTLTGAQTLSTGTKTLTAKLDAGGGTLEIPNSTTLPATCAVGDSYMDTDATTGQRFYLCESTNTWAQQGGGGGTPGGSSGQVQYNSSGSFAGDADLTFDGDFLSLGAASTKGLKFGTAMQATLSGGYLEWKDPTAATGATKFRVTKGAGDSTSTNIFFINDGSSNALTINARGDIVSRSIEVTAFAKYQSVWEFGGNKVEFNDTFLLGWASGSNINTTSEDVGLARDAAGVLRVSDGSTGYAKLRVNALDINDGGTRPTCDSSVRGTFWIDEGGAGVKDDVAVCAKDSGDAYAWRTIY